MNSTHLEQIAEMTRQTALQSLLAAETATGTAAQAYQSYADALTDKGDRDPRITDAVLGMFAASSACGDCRQAIRTMRGEHK